MKQLIDKSDLTAEIEKRLEAIVNASPEGNKQFAAIRGAQHYELISLVRFINTLETKEVDLEKEIFNYLDNHNLSIQDGGRIVFNNGDTPNLLCDFRDIAKFFFELGLKTKGE